MSAAYENKGEEGNFICIYNHTIPCKAYLLKNDSAVTRITDSLAVNFFQSIDFLCLSLSSVSLLFFLLSPLCLYFSLSVSSHLSVSLFHSLSLSPSLFVSLYTSVSRLPSYIKCVIAAAQSYGRPPAGMPMGMPPRGMPMPIPGMGPPGMPGMGPPPPGGMMMGGPPRGPPGMPMGFPPRG